MAHPFQCADSSEIPETAQYYGHEGSNHRLSLGPHGFGESRYGIRTHSVKVGFAEPARRQTSHFRIAILQGAYQRLFIRSNAVLGKLLPRRRGLPIIFHGDLWRGARKPRAS
jgi:hypothetical protein